MTHATSATRPAPAAHSHDRWARPLRNGSITHGAEKLPIQNRAGSSGDGICKTAAPNKAPPVAKVKRRGRQHSHRRGFLSREQGTVISTHCLWGLQESGHEAGIPAQCKVAAELTNE